ncbi:MULTISPECIES: hypothetical protein [unclassified Leptolyngbya]|uniref:hypothetical protein n=1 Tax=unclassified Leptolyngbya TaxID=2650499 RepID=UPI0016866AB5|nr:MULTISPECIES: hypothetical protein [unclassified Leptolyngbya]MBD1909052.1 hypothetical protein [Leptolyngbya sp. FACHB-8]MBD2157433.1 hypothetical protein [Leptolyngbya sp. FACHB-16]
MLLLVASRYDQAAQSFVNQWADHGVGLLTSQDLSMKGWHYEPGNPQESVAVVSGRKIAVHQIRGVLTRLPAVVEAELPQIVPHDRSYVSAEMTAFLSGWLSSLSCPLLNRPTATCLLGPNWSTQNWLLAAAQLGIPIQPIHQDIRLGSLPSHCATAGDAAVTVIGDRTLGDADPHLHTHAKRLAAIAGVNLLTAHFSNPTATANLIGAEPWADITNLAIATAIWNHITGEL